jgi:hypothetical protein
MTACVTDQDSAVGINTFRTSRDAFAFGQEKPLGFDPKTGKAGCHLKNTGSSHPAPDPPRGPKQSQNAEN